MFTANQRALFPSTVVGRLSILTDWISAWVWSAPRRERCTSVNSIASQIRMIARPIHTVMGIRGGPIAKDGADSIAVMLRLSMRYYLWHGRLARVLPICVHLCLICG